MQTRLKPMKARDILDVTFTILRERFWTFQGVIFFSFLPASLLMLGGLCFVMYMMYSLTGGWQFSDQTFSLLTDRLGVMGIILLVVVLILFILLLLAGSLFNMYGNIRIFQYGLHQEKCTVKQAFQGIGKKWLWFILLFIVMGVAASMGMIPGALISGIFVFTGSEVLQFIFMFVNQIVQLAVSFLLCLAPTVLTIEPDMDSIKALNRGFTLLNGHRWRVLGILILTYLLGYVLMLLTIGIIAIPIVLLVNFFNAVMIPLAVVAILLGFFLFNIMISYYFGPLTAIYYDLIIRKEGYDIQMQMAQAPAEANGANSVERGLSS